MRNRRIQPKSTKSIARQNRENIYGGYDYRKAYFQQNRGIFGYLYICSQCMKPMTSKTTIHVDHIIPPSRFAKKKKKRFKDTGIRKATLISNVLNHTFNCVTICPSCNSKKGNRVNGRILRGIVAKLVEFQFKTVQFTLTSLLWLSLGIVRTPFIGVGWLFRSKRRKR